MYALLGAIELFPPIPHVSEATLHEVEPQTFWYDLKQFIKKLFRKVAQKNKLDIDFDFHYAIGDSMPKSSLINFPGCMDTVVKLNNKETYYNQSFRYINDESRDSSLIQLIDLVNSDEQLDYADVDKISLEIKLDKDKTMILDFGDVKYLGSIGSLTADDLVFERQHYFWSAPVVETVEY